MGQIILLLFLASVLLSQPSSWADYDKNSISSAQPTGVSAVNTAQTAPQNRQTTKLFGRIEEIVQGPGAQFPLKAQTAKMDLSQTARVQQRAQASVFSGTIVRSFPQQYTGIWGGTLKIWSSQLDPICWQIDSDEANRMRQLFGSGKEGTVNFDFSQESNGTINLEPAQVVFMVPLKDTHAQEEMNQMIGSSSSLTLPGVDSQQMSTMMRQMAANMNVPIVISFGAINRTDVEGVSGNSIRAEVLKNSIRQLSPGVLEQQIITQETQRNNKTHKVRQEYAETVIRFTGQGSNSLYVQAAAVNYTPDRKFERKLILYGTVHKGHVMQDMSNPLGMLNNMMPAGSQLQQMPQSSGGQSQLQQLQNQLQNLQKMLPPQ